MKANPPPFPPPYCYLQPGTSPEAAALAILWELRRIAAKEASE